MEKMTYADAGKLGALKSAAKQKEQYLKRQSDYNLNPNLCNYCKIELSYKNRHNKFCTRSCAATSNNLGVCRNPNGNSGSYENNGYICPLKFSYVNFCKNCNKVLHGRKLRNVYCTHKCQRIFEWNILKSRIEETGKFEGIQTARRYLEEKNGNKCSICNRDPIWEEKPLRLVVDHINGNAEDWSISNLRLICPNCDSQTSTFKGRNAGKGRHSRRERYRKGLSY